jgi:hypothetical protein
LKGKRLEIKALGGWSVRHDGKPAARGKNVKIVLHALVLSRGNVFREDLADLIGNPEAGLADRDQAVRNALSKLRDLSLEIPPGENPVIVDTSQPSARIDLWEFFAHVACERYGDAYRMIEDGQEPHLLAGADDREHPAWQQTFADFEDARARTIAAIEATAGRRRTMLATREWLLARSLVPGVGQAMPIRKVRERLESLQAPWTRLRPEEREGSGHVSRYLASLLVEEGTIPNQVVVVGRPGAGKTTAAISTYLRLTDLLGEDEAASRVRTVLYLDPEAEGSQPGFGSDEWFEALLRKAGAEDDGRPIAIVAHGDAFLSRHQGKLRSVLDSRLFRDTDILLCCGEPLYSRSLSYEVFGTHVVRLEPWDAKFQRSFADALVGESKCGEFSVWLQQDPTRERLCSVPLHLAHVLSLLGGDPQALAKVTTPAQLFDGVARMRLRVAGHMLNEDQMMQDLASLAHRFYADAAPADKPIHFNPEELKLHLEQGGGGNLALRANALIDHTLLTTSPHGSDTLRFEEPTWGWFFVGWHIAHTLLHRPQETLEAFSKLLSADMASFCEEILAERLEHHRPEIQASLTLALYGGGAPGMNPARVRIARVQVGYLLGVLGDRQAHQMLLRLIEPDSKEREPDDLVRRGVILGLADAGRTDVADCYVDALTAERERGEHAPQQNANIGFLLSSRGDQSFDPERPDRIDRQVDPIRTVGDLVHGLEDSRYAGSWRIKLFTLIELVQHPEIPPDLVDQALTAHRIQLETTLDRLRQDPSTQGWPEVEQLARLLEPAAPLLSPR